MRLRLREGRSFSAAGAAPTSVRTIYYGEWEVLPEVRRVPEGELFGGTWVIRRCSFGRPGPDGYEVRTLLGDNEHFPTRREALHSAFLRAMCTIELDEVGAVHLCSIPSGAHGLGLR